MKWTGEGKKLGSRAFEPPWRSKPNVRGRRGNESAAKDTAVTVLSMRTVAGASGQADGIDPGTLV